MLLLDGLRAGVGIMITLGPLVLLDVSWPLAIVLGGVGIIFILFGYRVLAQSVSSITASADGLSSKGLRQQFLGWRDLRGLKLAYYAPMRRRHAGWYQLTLMGREGGVRIDSTIDGFDDLLRSALDAATHAGLAFDPSTRDNLAAWTHLSGLPRPCPIGTMAV